MKQNNQKTIKRIRTFLNEIEWLFNLNNYTKSITIKKEQTEDNLLASIITDHKYLTVDIEIQPLFNTYSEKDQRKVLLHELCHTLTARSKVAMYDLHKGKLVTEREINHINELETSTIENIIDRLLQNKLKYAKKAYKQYLKG